jgi:hypothetical protein
MTTPATTPADGELTLDASEVQFLAARLRRLFNHFKYPLPEWAKDDKHLIGIAPTCIGAVLANLNADRAIPSPGKAEAERWQPIETAPKDGTEILLTNGKTVAEGQWCDEEPYIREYRDADGRWIDQQESDGFEGWMDWSGGMKPDPTHWMPLPAAPQERDKQ